MSRISYPAEIKWAVVKEKMLGELATKEIMLKHGIKNKSQVETWMRWYQNNELHRFDQPVGKQYAYGKGLERKIVLQTVDNFIDKYTVTFILSVVDVPRSTHYRWRTEGINDTLSEVEVLIIELCKVNCNEVKGQFVSKGRVQLVESWKKSKRLNQNMQFYPL